MGGNKPMNNCTFLLGGWKTIMAFISTIAILYTL
jgi:hypothetical protein